jgi:hypothetical protein
MVTVVSAILIDWRRENGRLIKNVYPSTQADSPKTFGSLHSLYSAVTPTIPAGFMARLTAMKSHGVSLDRHSQTCRLLIQSAAQNDRAPRGRHRRPRERKP